jgi:LPXTG-site transpeptidase (sortase) family protein
MSDSKNNKSSRRTGLLVAAVVVILGGAALMLYPKATDLRYDLAQWRLSAGAVDTGAASEDTVAVAPGDAGAASAQDITISTGTTGVALPKGAVARIEIPAIHFKAYVLEGTDGSVLAKGPGHYVGTPLPGEAGNACIAGHRTTHGHAFRELNKLQPGDEIYTGTAACTAVYRVVKILIVSPTDTGVASQSGPDRLTLTTCHPKGSAKQRLVVVAELVK